MAGQSGEATLAFAPEPGQMGAGETATFALGAAGVSSLYGADIELQFDPAVAEVVDADAAREGVQVGFGQLLEPGFVVYNVADNSTGRARVTYTQVAPKAAANGAGQLLVIELRAKAAGDPRLRVTAALLARQDGSAQPVTVPAASQATPPAPQGSPVPNPTQLPTETPTAVGATASTTPVSAETRPPGSTTPRAIGPAAAQDNEDGDGLPATLIVVAALALAAAGGGAFALFRKTSRNGDRT